MVTTQGHLSQSQQDERLARAKAQAEKPKKGKFTGNLKTSPPTQPGDQKSVTPTPMPKAPQAKAGDQNDVTPEPKVKKVKKISETVRKWKDLENFGLEEKITIKVTGNPKKRDATRRFALYKDGMTVGDYLKVAKDNDISNALAHADVRWDHAAELTFVTGARYKSKKA